MKRMTFEEISTGSIAASGTYETDPIDICRGENFALILDTVTGTSPDFSVTYTVGVRSTSTFVTPDDNALITNASAACCDSFTPIPAPYIKLTFTNNNGANAVTISGAIIIQEA